jgi:putative transposase
MKRPVHRGRFSYYAPRIGKTSSSPTVRDGFLPVRVVEAFPYQTAPKYLLCARDGIYGADFVRRVRSMGIKQVVMARKSPWQNAYVERLIGSIRCECLDHVIVLNEFHLRGILRSYIAY